MPPAAAGGPMLPWWQGGHGARQQDLVGRCRTCPPTWWDSLGFVNFITVQSPRRGGIPGHPKSIDSPLEVKGCSLTTPTVGLV